MSVNNHKPHLIVLAEDDANRQMAHAFLLEIRGRMPEPRQIEVLRKRTKKPAKDGWLKTIEEKFVKDQIPVMYQYPRQMTLLLIDFDEQPRRLEYIQKQIPEDLNSRVFILGVWSEPEQLKKNLGQSFEKIGESLAQACINDSNELWQHDLLKHNLNEVSRMKPLINPLLFNDND